MGDAERLRDSEANTARSVLSKRRTALVVMALAAVGLGSIAWMSRHAGRSFDSGYGLEVRREVGATVWTSVQHGSSASPGDITIDSIEAEIVDDGAAVDVEYVICELDPATLATDGVAGFTYGGRDKDVRRYCERVEPAEGSTMTLGTDPGSELLVGITPSRPGRTVIERHHIEFGEGWQHGQDEIDVEVVLVAERP